MTAIRGLICRNLKVYFQDRQTVFFSMLTPILVFMLYQLFLKGTFVDTIEASLGQGKNLVEKEHIKCFVNGLLLAATLGTALITVPFQCAMTFVSDREKEITVDLAATPMTTAGKLAAYLISSIVTAFVISVVIMAVGLAVLYFMYDFPVEADMVLRLLGMDLLGAFSATCILMPVVMMFRSVSAASAFSGLIFAGSGFVIGAYIPLSQFSQTIQTICNLVPGTGVTVLLKQELMEPALSDMAMNLGTVGGDTLTNRIREVFSMDSVVFGEELTSSGTLLVMVGITVTFIAILCVMAGRNRMI